MTLDQATKQGITRVRRPVWAFPNDYLRIHVTAEGLMGPWAYLYSPVQDIPEARLPRPQEVPSWKCTETDYEPYTGPLFDGDTT